MLWRLCDFGIGRISITVGRVSRRRPRRGNHQTLLQKIDKKAKAISFGLASVPAKQALTKPVVDAVQAYLLVRPGAAVSGAVLVNTPTFERWYQVQTTTVAVARTTGADALLLRRLSGYQSTRDEISIAFVETSRTQEHRHCQ